MPKYVFAFRNDPDRAATPGEEEAWGAWFGGLGPAVVDGGNPFGASATIAGDGTVSDGAASALTGYAILSADSLAAATEMSKTCPILADGAGSIEIYETFAVM